MVLALTGKNASIGSFILHDGGGGSQVKNMTISGKLDPTWLSTQGLAGDGGQPKAAAIAPLPAVAPPPPAVGAGAATLLSAFLPGTRWAADPAGGFIKALAFTNDGNLVRTDSNNNTLRTAYQVGGDGGSVSYKKADGNEVTLRFSPDRRAFSVGAQTFKQLP